MPRFPRESNFNSPERRPKPRPAGSTPHRYESAYHRDRPAPRPQQRPAPRPSGPARIEPRKPASGKQRRQMMKAAAWRLAKIIHVRPADVITTLATQPKLELAFPGRVGIERRGEAARLAQKIWRLNRR